MIPHVEQQIIDMDSEQRRQLLEELLQILTAKGGV